MTAERDNSDDVESVSGAPNERFIRETGVTGRIAGAIEPVLIDIGYRLVRVTLSGRDGQTLQIMAERPDGTMTAGDCEKVSHAISPVIDVLDPLDGAFHLEVSSPGIDRPLVRPTDFDDWAGQEAKVELKELVSGRKRYRGVLEGFDDGEVRLLIEITERGQPARREVVGFPITMIAEAHLVMTDELIRESLRRAKKDRADDAQLDNDAADGVEVPDIEPFSDVKH